MSYYNSEDNVKQYIKMAEGYDGAELIKVLSNYLGRGATVLELGMGPGKDLDMLSVNFKASGSDLSPVFLDYYRKRKPAADLLLLDAVTLATDRSFDAIYSNKVLHCLSDAELRTSIAGQARLLNPDAYVLHSFWYGEGMEEFEGMQIFNRNESFLRAEFARYFEIVALERYKEMAEGDSIYILARKKA